MNSAAVHTLYWLTAFGGSLALAWGLWGGRLYWALRRIDELSAEVEALRAKARLQRVPRCFVCGQYRGVDHECPTAKFSKLPAPEAQGDHK